MVGTERIWLGYLDMQHIILDVFISNWMEWNGLESVGKDNTIGTAEYV